jgi:hypothetical protein
MPHAQLTNILGANGEGFSTGPVIQDVQNASTTVTLPFGTLAVLTTPITTTTTTVFTVGKATTTATAAALNIGVVIQGGGESGPGSAMAVNPGTGQLCIHGHCRALFDETGTGVTLGDYIIVGGTTAGCLGDSGGTTAAAGRNYGVILETISISTQAGTLVNIWFEKT